MKQDHKTVTRRDFLRGSACATIAFAMGLYYQEEKTVELPVKSKVILVRNEEAIDGEGKVDDAVSSLLDRNDPIKAWKLLVKPTDTVGIKSNVWGQLSTPKEVEQALRKRVIDAGVPEKKVDVDDRGILGNPVFQKANALINVRPLRTHAWAGVGGCIKNYVMFVPKPDKYHEDSCANLGAIWNLPAVKGKTRLNVLVMLRPLFYGRGHHHFDPDYVWPYRGILVGTDPVALDAVGLKIFQAKRLAHFGEERPLKPPAHHVLFADTRHKIGTSDLRKIELVKLGWEEGILI